MKFLLSLVCLICAAVLSLRAAPAGSVDASFNIGSGPNSSISCIIAFENNKILVGGSFSSWSGVNVRPLVLLDPDGSHDQGFIAPNGSYSVRAISLKADGKILFSGSFQALNGESRTNLAQLHPNGSLDLGFTANTDNYVADMLELPDGRILITGAFEKVNGMERPGIALLLPNGDVDMSWVPPIGITGLGRSLHFSAKSGISVAGLSWGNGYQNITGLIRMRTNGVIDRAFDLGSPSFFADKIFRLPQDGFLLRSTFYPSRVLSNDSLDQHFVNGTTSSFAEIMGVQADERFFFSGTSLKDKAGNSSTFLRAFADGRIDPGFISEIDGTPELSLQRADGKIIVAGFLAPKGQNKKFNILALHENDATNPPSVQWYASSLGSIHNGTIELKILRDGDRSGETSFKWNATFDPAVVQLSPVGQALTFVPNETHKIITLNISSSPRANGVINFNLSELQGGQFGTNKTLALYLTNEISTVSLASGVLSVGETTGLFSFALNREGALNRPIAVGWRLETPGQTEPKMVLKSGMTHFPAGRDFTFIYNRVSDDTLVDGDLTNDFEIFPVDEFGEMSGSTNGVMIVHDNDLPGYPGRGADNGITTSVKLADGGLLIHGSFTTVNGSFSPKFARLKANGAIDPGFTPPPIDGEIYKFAELPDGRIIVAGSIQTLDKSRSYSLLRLHPNGAIDKTFDPDPLPSAPRDLAVVSDGILLTGSATIYNGTQSGTNRGVVIKLNHNGRRDKNFATTTATFNVANTPFLNVSRVRELPNGKFYVYGNIAAAARPYVAGGQIPPTLNVGIALFNADGSYDQGFQTQVSYVSVPGVPRPVTGMDLVKLIQPYPDGKVLVVGDFNRVNGQSAPGITRLLANGNLDLPFHTNIVQAIPASLKVVEVALLPNNEILTIIPSPVSAGPTPHPFSGIVRFNADGTRKSVLNFGAYSLAASSGTLQALENGNAFAGGSFTTIGSETAFRMAWLNAQGLPQVEPGTVLEIVRSGDLSQLKIYSTVNGDYDLQRSVDLDSWNLLRTVRLQRGLNFIPLYNTSKEECFRILRR